jgi:hypothetical protein
MTATPPQTGLSARDARALLTSFQPRILAFVELSLPGAIDRTRKHLFDLADTSDSYSRAAHWMSAYLQLGHQSGALKLACLQAVPTVLETALEQVLGSSQPSPASNRQGKLALVDLKETERTVLFDRAARPFNTEYEDLLTPLAHRISLMAGHADLLPAHNPYRPEVFLRIFLRGWEIAKLDDEAAEDLLLALNPPCFLPLGGLYEELNNALIRAGVAPDLLYQIRKARDTQNTLPGEREALRRLFAGELVDANTGSSPGMVAVPYSAPSNLQALAPAPHAAEEIDFSATAAIRALNAEGGGLPAPRTAPPAAVVTPMTAASAQRNAALPALQQQGVLTGAPLRRAARDSLEQMIVFGQQLQHNTPGPDGFAHTQPVANPAILNWLATLQARTLATPLREDRPPQRILQALSMRDELRNAPPLDRHTVDALAAVFDFLFEDFDIPHRMKHVLSKLQVPVLKAAIINRGFFGQDGHPARQLLDMLAGASVGWRPESGIQDPLYRQIEKTVQRVLVEFHDKPELFQALRDDFERFLFELEREVVQNVAPYTSEVTTNEKLELALRACDECLHEHLRKRDPAPLLVPFLLREWRLVMAYAWGNRKARRDIWDRAVATMDGLIWSTEAKHSLEERRKLVIVLPRLVASLNAAIDAIGWKGEARTTFTRRLIEVHSECVQARGHTPADPKRLAREKQEARVAWHELQARRAELFLQDEDRFDVQAHQLASGAWFDFIAQDGVQNRYRLSMVSPMRTRYVFSLNDGKQAFVRNEREVAKSLREGRLKLLDAQPMTSRAINDILVNAQELGEQAPPFPKLTAHTPSAA